jgi:hypothetical protein
MPIFNKNSASELNKTAKLNWIELYKIRKRVYKKNPGRKTFIFRHTYILNKQWCLSNFLIVTQKKYANIIIIIIFIIINRDNGNQFIKIYIHIII